MVTSFSSLQSRLHEVILSNKVYVDKTNAFLSFIHFLDSLPRLHSANVAMIIRPHGFALSLGTEIITALLERDELIIDVLEKQAVTQEPPERPVIRISFGKSNITTAARFSEELVELMQMQLWEHHIESGISSYEDPRSYFYSLIKCIAGRRGQAVAVIIDNYDLPFLIARRLRPAEQQLALSAYLDMLNAVRIAGNDVCWCLLTGHIKFPLASEFSEGLPLINDLSFSPACDTLFGFTRSELLAAFGESISRFAPRQGITPQELLQALEVCYGGMVFSDRRQRMFCPFSIDAAFANEGLLYSYVAGGDYHFLQEVLLEKRPDLSWLFSGSTHEAYFAREIPLAPAAKAEFAALLMQQGFVTIDRIRRQEGTAHVAWQYAYRVPNIEHQRTLKVLLGLAAPQLLTSPINPQVYAQGGQDFDLEDAGDDPCLSLLNEHCVF